MRKKPESTKPSADPYVFLDATCCKARVGRRVGLSQAVVVAVGVAADGRREVLGFEVGDTESQPFWTTFLRSLNSRGLDGVKLVISDAHTGLIAAVQTVFQGSSWQRCRVHFMRNMHSNLQKAAGPMVAPTIRTVFAQPDKNHFHTQFEEVVRMLTRSHPPRSPRCSTEPARTCWRSPRSHPRTGSNLVHESVGASQRRDQARTNVAGTVPNPAAQLHLAGHVLIEQHDEWDGADRRYFSERSMKPLDARDEEVAIPELTAAQSHTAELAR